MDRSVLSLICLLAVVAGALSDGTQTPETIYKLYGDHLNLECVSNAIVKWYFNGQVVTDNNHTKIDTQSTKTEVNNLLEIETVTESGTYECVQPSSDSTSKKFQIILVDIDSDQVSFTNSSVIDLQCRVQTDNLTFYPITWKRNDEVLQNGTDYEIIPNDNGTVLRVIGPELADVGAYMCVIQIKDDNSTVEGEASITLKPSVAEIENLRSRVEGEIAKIECKVSGYPVPAIKWLKRKDEEGASDVEVIYDTRISATENSDGVPNAKLMITELTIEQDKAFYTCIATNYLDEANTTVLLKVKDKNAAVWPFLGICAEVITLCCIIFIFEKRRNRRMEEEEEVEAVKQELMNGTAESEDKDLRQRNVNNTS